ncbi:unnamed protein product [Rhodiola kirilowii]
MQLVQYNNPLDIHHPQPRQMPRQEPVYDNYYGDVNYRAPTMGELNEPKFETQPWCICEGPELENIVVDMYVVHNLPKFSGTNGESAMTHLQRLHGTCQILKPNRVNIDDFKLKVFYFSLIDSANDWFLSLPSDSIRTWVQMQRKFLDKYCPATKAMQVRRQLQDIRQGPNETMYDYLEKFNHLERSCCTLELPEKLIIEYLINGLTELDKMLLDASAGGSMMNLSLSGIRDLITNVAENAPFRKETTRQDKFFRTKNVVQAETLLNSMPEEMRQIKEMMMQLLQKQTVQVKPCEFCGSTNHKTDACPTVLVENPAEINILGGYQGHNNNSYSQEETQPAIPQLAQSFYQPLHQQYNQDAPSAGQFQASSSNQQEGPNKSLEDMLMQLSGTMQQLNTTMHKNLAETKDLKNHISQLAT